ERRERQLVRLLAAASDPDRIDTRRVDAGDDETQLRLRDHGRDRDVGARDRDRVGTEAGTERMHLRVPGPGRVGLEHRQGRGGRVWVGGGAEVPITAMATSVES